VKIEPARWGKKVHRILWTKKVFLIATERTATELRVRAKDGLLSSVVDIEKKMKKHFGADWNIKEVMVDITFKA
jgi:hypothetical protein